MGDEAREVSQSKEALWDLVMILDFFSPMGNGKSLLNFKQESEMITFAFLNDNWLLRGKFLGWNDGFIHWKGTLEEEDLEWRDNELSFGHVELEVSR